MKALSVRAPWWWFILYGGKDIENRDWSTKFRGRVLIHASKWWNLDEVIEDTADAIQMRILMHEPLAKGNAITYRQMRDIGGSIVGSVEIADCIGRNSIDSPWFVGDFGFVLRDPIAFSRPIPFKGALGFFDVPDAIAEPSGL